MLRDDIARNVQQLAGQLGRVMEELHTLADPDAAAAQIETVTTEAGRQVVEAEAKASRRGRYCGPASWRNCWLANVPENERQAGELAAAAVRVEELSGELATMTADRDREGARRSEELARQLGTVTGERDAAAAEVRRPRDELAAAREQTQAVRVPEPERATATRRDFDRSSAATPTPAPRIAGGRTRCRGPGHLRPRRPAVDGASTARSRCGTPSLAQQPVQRTRDRDAA